MLKKFSVLFVVLMLLMGSTNASAKDSQIVNWILVMTIFEGSGNSPISDMEILKSFADKKACSNAIKQALTIKMPVAKEFRCLKMSKSLAFDSSEESSKQKNKCSAWTKQSIAKDFIQKNLTIEKSPQKISKKMSYFDSLAKKIPNNCLMDFTGSVQTENEKSNAHNLDQQCSVIYSLIGVLNASKINYIRTIKVRECLLGITFVPPGGFDHYPEGIKPFWIDNRWVWKKPNDDLIVFPDQKECTYPQPFGLPCVGKKAPIQYIPLDKDISRSDDDLTNQIKTTEGLKDLRRENNIAGVWCGKDVDKQENCKGDEVGFLNLKQVGVGLAGEFCEAYQHDCIMIRGGEVSDKNVTFGIFNDVLRLNFNLRLLDGNYLKGTVFSSKCNCDLPISFFRINSEEASTNVPLKNLKQKTANDIENKTEKGLTQPANAPPQRVTQKMPSDLEKQADAIKNEDNELDHPDVKGAKEAITKLGKELDTVPNISNDAEQKRALKSYIYSIKRQIASARRYPEESRRAGREGKTRVQFTILKNGEVTNIHLVTKSPYPKLNQETIAVIKRAAPFLGFPDKINKEKITIILPYSFSLIH